MRLRAALTALWLSGVLILVDAGAQTRADHAPGPPVAEAGTPSTAARELPPEMQQQIAELAQGLARVRDADPELSCGKAVENARWGVETMLETGEKNLRGGYLSQAQYETVAGPLKAMLAQISLSDCQAASGSRKAFYQCMSSDYNHVFGCNAEHPF